MKSLRAPNVRTWILLLVLALLGLVPGVLLLLSRYPWESPVSVSESGVLSAFTSYWPKSPLEDAIAERNRMNRFAKAEQRRRLGIQLRRMEFINATALEMERDPSVVVERDRRADQIFRSYQWPYLHSLDPTKPQLVQFLLPFEGGFASRSGMLLRSGDQIRFSSDIAREPRSLIFYAFPLMESQIRGSLGKYTSNTVFESDDVQQLKRVSISIGDVTATQFRLTCLSGEVFLLFPRVTRFEQSGRLPIQLDPSDAIFEPAETFLGESELTGVEAQEEDQETLREPLEELSNPVVKSSGDLVALGYNLVLIKSPHPLSPSSVAKYEELSRFLRASAVYRAGFQSESEPWDQMSTLLATSSRLFGYHTVAFSGVAEKDGARLSSISGRVAEAWLIQSDAQHADANRRLSRGDAPAKGLDAIFDSGQEKSFPAMTESRWSELSAAQGLILQAVGELSDFRAAENYFVGAGEGSYSRFLEVYQDWSKDQWQNRFVHLVDLESFAESAPSFQALFAGLRLGWGKIWSPGTWREQALRMSSLKTLEQTLESLRARRLTNRTVVAIVEPADDDPENGMRVRLQVPGLVPRGGQSAFSTKSFSTAKQVALHLLALVGAEVEEPSGVSRPLSDVQTARRFRLSILTRQDACGRVRWRAGGPLSDLKWDGVRVEGHPDTGVIDIYPCSAKKEGTVFWIQGDIGALEEGEPDSRSPLGGSMEEALERSPSEGPDNGVKMFFGVQALSPAELRLAQILSMDELMVTGQKEFREDPSSLLRSSLGREGLESGIALLLESEPLD